MVGHCHAAIRMLFDVHFKFTCVHMYICWDLNRILFVKSLVTFADL